jgi:hypothetical protein
MTYPAGQADTGVTTQVAANIVASIPKIMIVRMRLSCSYTATEHGICPPSDRIVPEISI